MSPVVLQVPYSLIGNIFTLTCTVFGWGKFVPTLFLAQVGDNLGLDKLQQLL